MTTTQRSFLGSIALPVPAVLRISDEGVDRLIRAKSEAMRDYFRARGCTKAVMALDGHVDSAVACALAVQALGSANVIVFKMAPYNPFGEAVESMRVAAQVTRALGITAQNQHFRSIEDAVTVTPASCENLSPVPYARRNADMAARERMKILMDAAMAFGALAVGSLNLTEHQLTTYVRGGDDVADLQPIRDLFQTEVYQVAARQALPESALLRSPRTNIGVDCVTADIAILFGTKWEPEEGVELAVDLGFDESQVRQVIARMEQAKGQREAPHVLKTHRRW
jgi:NAD+ synthetase